MKITKETLEQWILPVILIILGAGARLVPHPANVAPIAAIALFGAMYLPRRMALVLPLIALFISDLMIGWYELPMMLSVYGSFLIIGLIGLAVRKRKNVVTIVGGTLLGSVLFYIITNGVGWMFGSLYPHTAAGLIESYTMAIPFFRNTLLGDLFFVGLLVGSKEAVSLLIDSTMKKTA